MVNKFAIIIAGIVAAMGIIIALPNINTDQAGDFKLEYSKQELSRTESGVLGAVSVELLSIDKNGLASYSKDQSAEKQLQLSKEETGRIKGLILETGFLEIPKTDYLQKDGVTEFTKYTVKITAEGRQKTINWVNESAHEGIIPPIISNLGLQLDSAIAKFG